jgi:hypothetical protein
MLDNIWFIAAVWMGLALLASLISIRTGISVALIEIVVGVVVGNLAVGFEGGTLQVGTASANASAGHLHHILQSTEWTNFLALLGERRAYVSCWCRNRSCFAESQLARERSDRRALICCAVCCHLVCCAIHFQLAYASGADCRNCSVDDLCCCRVCSDDRRRIQRHCHGQDDSRCVLHHRLRDRARPWHPVRQL